MARQRPRGGEPAAGSLDRVRHAGAEYVWSDKGTWTAADGTPASRAISKELDAWRAAETDRRVKREGLTAVAVVAALVAGFVAGRLS